MFFFLSKTFKKVFKGLRKKIEKYYINLSGKIWWKYEIWLFFCFVIPNYIINFYGGRLSSKSKYIIVVFVFFWNLFQYFTHVFNILVSLALTHLEIFLAQGRNIFLGCKIFSSTWTEDVDPTALTVSWVQGAPGAELTVGLSELSPQSVDQVRLILNFNNWPPTLLHSFPRSHP